jgi:hypothetical protein
VAKAIDVLNRTYVAPLMVAAGFRRRGRDYFRQTAEWGDWTYLGVSGQPSVGDGLVRFRLDARAATPGRLSWLRHLHSLAEEAFPSVASMLRVAMLDAQEGFMVHPLLPAEWVFDPELDMAGIGSAVSSAIESKGLPLLDHVQVRSNLLDAIRTDRPKLDEVNVLSRDMELLMASIDSCPIDNVEKMLAAMDDVDLAHPDNFTRWALALIDGRRTAQER